MYKGRGESLKESLLKTLAYRDYFNYPLTYYQLRTSLIGDNGKYKHTEFLKILKELVNAGKIHCFNGRYTLRGKNFNEWEKRAKYSLNLFNKSKDVFDVLHLIPWIKMLAVTGSVAAYSAKRIDDIDIFIVCKKDRSWITRFFVVLLLKIIRKYRTDTNYSGKICPNIFVDETRMLWDKKKRNIYVATEIVNMWPIINRDDTYFKFLNKNSWLNNYYPSFNCNFSINNGVLRKSLLLDSLENVCRLVQLIYMRGGKTTELTKKDIIHFNRDDWTEKILLNYNFMLDKVLLKEKDKIKI